MKSLISIINSSGLYRLLCNLLQNLLYSLLNKLSSNLVFNTLSIFQFRSLANNFYWNLDGILRYILSSCLEDHRTSNFIYCSLVSKNLIKLGSSFICNIGKNWEISMISNLKYCSLVHSLLSYFSSSLVCSLNSGLESHILSIFRHCILESIWIIGCSSCLSRSNKCWEENRISS